MKQKKEIIQLPITPERIERQRMVDEMLKPDGYRFAVFKQSISGHKMVFVVAHKTQQDAEEQCIKLLADQLTKQDRAAFSVIEIKKSYIFDGSFKEI
jgi:hypothetical protein